MEDRAPNTEAYVETLLPNDLQTPSEHLEQKQNTWRGILEDLHYENDNLAAENSLLKQQVFLQRENSSLKTAKVLADLLVMFENSLSNNVPRGAGGKIAWDIGGKGHVMVKIPSQDAESKESAYNSSPPSVLDQCTCYHGAQSPAATPRTAGPTPFTPLPHGGQTPTTNPRTAGPPPFTPLPPKSANAPRRRPQSAAGHEKSFGRSGYTWVPDRAWKMAMGSPVAASTPANTKFKQRPATAIGKRSTPATGQTVAPSGGQDRNALDLSVTGSSVNIIPRSSDTSMIQESYSSRAPDDHRSWRGPEKTLKPTIVNQANKNSHANASQFTSHQKKPRHYAELRPNRRFIGEVCYQLDRRILSYVFSGQHMEGKERKRFYGYTIENIPQMIMLESADAKTGMLNMKKKLAMQYRFDYIMNSLGALGYKITRHPAISMQLVNKYGLLSSPPEKDMVEKYALGRPDILKALLESITPTYEWEDVSVMAECLILMADDDGKPLFLM